MKRRYNETETECAKRIISEKRTAAAMFPALCEVIRAFDGKVYNKRLDNAIRDRFDRCYIQKKEGAYNSKLWVYLYTGSGDTITILWCDIPENKRINSADMIEQASKTRAELLQEAAHLESIIPTIETRREQIEQIKNLLAGVLDDLSYEEKEIFNLNMRLH